MSDLPYEPIDHTADAGFRVRGATLAELFANAARCLFEMLGEVGGVRPDTSREIRLTADGHAALFRSWLSEMLYVSYVGKLVLCEAEVRSVDEAALHAVVRGEPYDEERHERHPEIKAVTWHDLDVRRTPAGWEAVFILDL